MFFQLFPYNFLQDKAFDFSIEQKNRELKTRSYGKAYKTKVTKKQKPPTL